MWLAVYVDSVPGRDCRFPVLMTDFTPVPPCTAAAAALTLRGSNPDIAYAPASNFANPVGVSMGQRNGVAGQMLLQYSSSCIPMGYCLG